MDSTVLLIAIWVLLGLAIVWTDRTVQRGERVTPDEAGAYNMVRSF